MAGGLLGIGPASVAVLAVSGPGWAQAITLTQSVEPSIIQPGASIGCTQPFEPATTADNFWSRSFTLADFAVPASGRFVIERVVFGIERLDLPTLGETDLTVRLFALPAGSPPLGPRSGREYLGEAVVTVGPRSLEFLAVDVRGALAGDRALMVEVEALDFLALAGVESGNFMYIGANNLGQYAPSYLASPMGCGIPDPTDLADFDYEDVHVLLAVEGRIEGVCRADFDGDGSLTIFDFLAFRNAFDAGEPSADFTADRRLDIFDFLAFQNEFDAGCA